MELTERETEFLILLFNGTFFDSPIGYEVPAEYYWVARSLEIQGIIYIKESSWRHKAIGQQIFLVVLEKTSGLIADLQVVALLAK